MTRTVGAAFERKLAREGNLAFVKYGQGWLTIDEVNRTTVQLGAGLARLGAKKGDRVAIILPSKQESFELFLACARIGLIQVPIHPFLKGEFLRYQLIDSGAKILITDADGLKAAGPYLTGSAVEQVVILGPTNDTPPVLPLTRYIDLHSTAEDLPAVDIQPGDLVSIVYTSGTTGRSKGCMLSHGYYTVLARAFQKNGWMRPNDRVFTAFGFNHLSGPQTAMMAIMTDGASACFEPEFHASTFMDRMAEEHSTVLFGVGAMGRAILATPEKESDADRRHRIGIWIPLGPASLAEWERRFRSPAVAEGIGQTECAPITVGGTQKRGSLGHPVDYLDVRLVDDGDIEVPAGEIGEIVVRPLEPNVMYSGYWNKPDASVAAWRNLWHHTGDLARADEDGCLHFVDRKTDSIRRRGENISSFELEAAIAAHPKVAQAAICALPSAIGDVDIKVCIVLEADTKLELEELFEFFKDHLPYFAVPRYVEFRESLPLTPATGRIQKHKLREEGVTDRTHDLDALGLRILRSERR